MKFLFLICGLFFTTNNKTPLENPHEKGISKVIFFAGSKCSNNCYESNSYGKKCIWFQLGYEGLVIADLSDYTSHYTEEYDCQTGYSEYAGDTYCKYRTASFNWGSEINRVYSSDPRTIIILFSQKNFNGESVRISGKGCCDLKKNSWHNKAQSVKIFFQ